VIKYFLLEEERSVNIVKEKDICMMEKPVLFAMDKNTTWHQEILNFNYKEE